MPLILPETVLNPTAGNPLSAAWGDAQNDAVRFLGRDCPRCRAIGSHNVPTATVTAVLLATESYDVGGMHSTSVNTSRLTVPAGEAGYYEIGGGVKWTVNASGVRENYLRLNGATTISGSEVLCPSGSPITAYAIPTVEVLLSAGDYVELIGNQTSGTTLNCAAALWARWTGRT